MPSAEDVAAAKQQQRGAGIPVIIGTSAAGRVDAAALSRLLDASALGAPLDGLAAAFSDLGSLAVAAEPGTVCETPGECVISVLGTPLRPPL